MKISEYLRQEVFLPRLEDGRALVVYDPDKRYRGIVEGMASEESTVVLYGDGGTFQCRQEAQGTFSKLGKSKDAPQQLLIYLTRSVPSTDEGRQLEPFAAIAAGGRIFPEGDGDSYQALCRKAKPTHSVEVDRLFADGEPSFEHVDALDEGEGGGWPRLKTMTSGSSPEDILFKFLTADKAQQKECDQGEEWVDEAKDFLHRILGLKVVTKGRKWKSLSSEAWRYILFSEFVFDLPEGMDLPQTLASVPKADGVAKDFVYKVCDRLRDSSNARETYIEQAAEVAKELQLEELTQCIEDLGERDTFAFEERSFLKLFAKTAMEGDIGGAETILHGHRGTVWVKAGNSAQDWEVASRSLDLLKAIEDYRRENPTLPSQLPQLVDLYLAKGRRIDTLHREFHQALEGMEDEPAEELKGLVDMVDTEYNTLASDRTGAFTAAVSRDNWPPQNIPSAREVFGKYVEPALDDRERIAYILVDSLRYELAMGLKSQLEDSFVCNLHGVAAQLPTITPVGMASLMPDAKEKFELKEKDRKLVPMIDGKEVSDPDHRLACLKSKLGDRVQMETLKDFLEQGTNLRIQPTVNLLVIRTLEIDRAGEVSADLALSVIPRELSKLKRTLRLLRELDFKSVVIATDHGFHLTRSTGSGNTVEKPDGDWLMTKRRSLLGDGGANNFTYSLPTADVDIPGDAKRYCVPKNLGTFEAGVSYFHEGLSPQECILPLMEVDLGKVAEEGDGDKRVLVDLKYRGGKTSVVTTRRPSLEIQFNSTDLLIKVESLKVAMEAKGKEGDDKGELVGEPGLGPAVDPATQLLNLEDGKAVRVTLKLFDEFSGKFEVILFDPETKLTYATLELKTDILE